MDRSLLNPRDVCSYPVAGVLAVTAEPPVTDRPVEGKAFQEVNTWGQLSSSTLSQHQKRSILAGGLGCVGLSPCVFSHRNYCLRCIPHWYWFFLGACCTLLVRPWSRPGISLELQNCRPCIPVFPQFGSLSGRPWMKLLGFQKEIKANVCQVWWHTNTFNPSTHRQRQAYLCKFKTSLVYIVSCRSARVT